MIQVTRMLKSIAAPAGRALWPATAWLRWAVWSALFVALACALVATSVQVSLDRQCKGGAFSNGFSAGFDIRRCGIVFEHIPTGAKITIPLPSSWI